MLFSEYASELDSDKDKQMNHFIFQAILKKSLCKRNPWLIVILPCFTNYVIHILSFFNYEFIFENASLSIKML